MKRTNFPSSHWQLPLGAIRSAAAVMLLSTWAVPVKALDREASYLAAPEEYVVSVPNIKPLRIKALRELNKLSRVKLGILSESRYLMVVGPAGKPRRLPEEARPVRPLEGLPGVVKRARRSARRAYGASIEALRFATQDALVPNYQVSVSKTPNDSYYSLEWGLHQDNGIDIKAPEAWEKTQGAASVIVGVIDSGVDYTHPDLAANMWSNSGEIPNNGIDDDHNGYVDDVHGFNAIQYANSGHATAGDPMDDHGHGTHVSGTIGAASNNGVGVSGVNWTVQIVPIKFLNSSGNGYLSDAVDAIDYAVALKSHGVNIVALNNSWGGGPFVTDLYNAIQRARDAGIVFLAAAGNSSQNTDNTPAYPAGYNLENVVSVGAIGQNGDLASFSNYGSTTVDIAAPGVQIASTYPGNRYVYMSGTSMACPHVTGAIALLKSYSYNLDWRALISTLYSAADTRANLSGQIVGGRSLNLDRMLSSVPSVPAPPRAVPPTATPTPVPATPTPTPSPTPTPTVAPGNFNLTGVVSMNGAPLSGVKISLQIGGTTSVRLTTANGQFRFDAVPGPVAYTLTASKAGLQFAPISGMLLRDTNLAVNATGRTYKLSVRIQSPSRNPVSGVLVDVGPYGHLITDGQGEVSFDVDYGALYSVLASSSQYNLPSTSLTGELLGDTTRLVIARPKPSQP